MITVLCNIYFIFIFSISSTTAVLVGRNGKVKMNERRRKFRRRIGDSSSDDDDSNQPKYVPVRPDQNPIAASLLGKSIISGTNFQYLSGTKRKQSLRLACDSDEDSECSPRAKKESNIQLVTSEEGTAVGNCDEGRDVKNKNTHISEFKSPERRFSQLSSSDSSIANFLPNFTGPHKQPDEPIVLSGKNGIQDAVIHRWAARSLMDHQVVGVRWLWDNYCEKKGCILG